MGCRRGQLVETLDPQQRQIGLLVFGSAKIRKPAMSPCPAPSIVTTTKATRVRPRHLKLDVRHNEAANQARAYGIASAQLKSAGHLDPFRFAIGASRSLTSRSF